MTQFDDAYYIVHSDYTEKIDDNGIYSRFIGAKPKDEWTANNHSDFLTENPSELMRFMPDDTEDRLAKKIPGEIADLNMITFGFLTRPWVYDLLRFKQTRGVQWLHAVYYDIYGEIHEPLHYMKIIEPMDFWDRERSELRRPYDPDSNRKAKITKLSLNENMLSVLPLEERLVLKLGITVNPAQILFHESIVEPLIEKGATGVRFFKVSEYRRGMEFE